MTQACDLAEVPAWRAHRAGRDARSARVCFGPGARLITWLARADGLVLGRRVFLSPASWRLVQESSSEALALLEHEVVHVEQYRRLGFVGFLRRYLSEYLVGRWRGLGHWKAYRAISLEEEARCIAAARMAHNSAFPEPRPRELPGQGALDQRS